MAKLFLFLLAGLLALKAQAQTVTLSGRLTDAENGEALIGASVFVQDLQKGTVSNFYGYYSLTLPAGRVNVTVAYLGYEKQEKELNLQQDAVLDLALQPVKNNLREVVIRAGANEEREAVTSTQMSSIRITPSQIKNLPALGGEVDVLKVMQLMPGVKRGGEGQTGMYVRGGGADQNLILLDEATVYNVSHLFGFFSVFNHDALKDVTLLKGAFPASYGGRAASVLDIRMKEGDSDSLHAEGGIGLLSTRLTVQGPVKKDKASFLVSGRRSYIDKALGVAGLSVPYYFYDLNTKINYRLSAKDHVYFSTYYGNDVLFEPKQVKGEKGAEMKDMNLDFGFRLGNKTATFRWNHIYTPKLFSNLSLIYTSFRYDINGKFNDNSVFIGSRIRDLGLKLDYDYFYSPSSQFRFGLQLTNHRFRPNIIAAEGEISESLKSGKGRELSPNEVALYALHEKKFTDKLTLNYGLRLSGIRTLHKTYAGPEPRVAATYAFNQNNSIKASYSRMYQYMHLVSNASLALPTDLWYPVTDAVKPQTADQVAAGYTHFSEKAKLLFTLEGYYKKMHHLIEYREGAVLALNDDYEQELLSGEGEAYGGEVFVNRTQGRFTGWVGYSLSWATRQFDGLNDGKKYFAKYDRRHDLSLVGTYQLSQRLTLSAVWTYATGQRLTGRAAQYAVPNPALSGIEFVPVYTDRNALRFSPSHRLDLSLTLQNRPHRRFRSEWQLGAYNVYNRTQPYRVRLAQDAGGNFKYQQVGLFGFLPSVSYNFKF